MLSELERIHEKITKLVARANELASENVKLRNELFELRNENALLKDRLGKAASEIRGIMDALPDTAAAVQAPAEDEPIAFDLSVQNEPATAEPIFEVAPEGEAAPAEPAPAETEGRLL